MKFTWEPEDVPKMAGTPIAIEKVKERFMLGYSARLSGSDARYCLISLADGMVMNNYTKEELAHILNAGAYRPYFIGTKRVQTLMGVE